MTSNVEIITQFHQARLFGPDDNLVARSTEANLAYHALSDSEISVLVEMALAGDEIGDGVFASLACLKPDSLKRFHPRLVEREIFYPAVIYHEADTAHCGLNNRTKGPLGNSENHNSLTRKSKGQEWRRGCSRQGSTRREAIGLFVEAIAEAHARANANNCHRGR